MNNINCLVVYTPKYFVIKNKTGPTADIIIANLKETSRLINIYTAGVVGVIFFYLIIPTKYFLFDNERILILPLYIPFCDEKTFEGWLTACCAQTILGAYSGIATVM